MTIRIRPANILDAEALVAIQSSSGTASPHSPSTEASWQNQLMDPGPTTTWVATDDAVVGFIHVEAVGPGFPELVRVNDLGAFEGSVATRAALLNYALGDFGAYADIPAVDLTLWSDLGFTEQASTDAGTVVVVRNENNNGG